MGTPARQFSERVVLVVDDDDLVRHYMTRALKDAGFRVLEAHDGEEALRHLGATAIGLVVSDVAMPRVTGLELAKVIAERWPTLPVLLVSGEAVPPDGYRRGFLPKPFTPDTLVDTVNGLLPFPQRESSGA
jgi:DNA-binding NtrC family response regulator